MGLFALHLWLQPNLIFHPNYSEYYICVQDGIALWGDVINFTYTPYSINVFYIDYDDGDEWTGLAKTYYDPLTDHKTHWEIYLNSYYFDDPNLMPLTNNDKARTVAHEIGHVYGLGHVTNHFIYNGVVMYPLMYPSSISNRMVSIYDKAGMSVVTHQHKHEGPLVDPKYNFIHFTPTNELQIENGSNTHHKIRCTVCFAYVEDEHEFVLKMNHGSHWFECDVEGCTKQVDFLSHHYDPNGECTVCGYSSCTHAWGPWTTVTTATCMQPGIEKSVCTLNGSHYQTRVNPVNANAHN